MKQYSIILLMLLLACGISSARPVSGEVRAGDKKLAGVVVTDGYGFAKTDAAGKFRLDLNDNADFVHVITPSGYTAQFDSGSPEFYHKTEKSRKRYDFDLLAYGNEDHYVLLALADPQTQTDRHLARFESETVVDMEAVSRNYEAAGQHPVGITLGDITWDIHSYFGGYKNAIAKTDIPVYAVIGNHDHDPKGVGDHPSSADYRKNFGPEYYGFNLGRDYYVVLDNIDYVSDRKFGDKISDGQIKWLEGYLKYVPEGSRVVVCMHIPFKKFHETNKYVGNGDELLKLTAKYKLSFLSGHTHVNRNYEVAPGVMEHNIGAACGDWWVGDYCRDGTPSGYQVFEGKGGALSWYYKSTGKDASFQTEAYDRGTFVQKPNAVVVKAWNWDSQWKAEWYQDGVKMGDMERFSSLDPDYCRFLQQRREEGKAEPRPYKLPIVSSFFFAAVPDLYAREVKVVVTDRFGREYTHVVPLTAVDVQGHRGGLGLMPENTVEAMINAVRLGVNTLELDLNISRDRQVVVSHDPWMSYLFAIKPDGTNVTKEEQREYAIFRMDYDSIKRYDTGSRGNSRYPQQKKIKTHKPLLTELIDAVEKYTSENGYTPMNYNIEIKSAVDRDGLYSPPYKEFTDLVMDVLLSKNLGDRLVLQCFDVRNLNYIHKKYPQVVLSYLVDDKQPDFDVNMAQLDFVPRWYSPHHSLVNAQSLERFHAAGMKVVPWTVDEPADIRRMVDLGVDAIISNYPDRVLIITRKY